MKKLLAALLLLAIAPVGASAATITSPALGNIFAAGEPVSVTYHARGDKAHWSLKDFFGKEAASGDATLSGGMAVVPIRTTAQGYFTLDISSGADQAQTSLTILPPAKPASAASPFGVVTHFAKGWPTDVAALIEKAGIKQVRDEQPWRKIEKAPGHYDVPPDFGAYMAQLSAHHLDPLVELDFANPLYDGDKTPYTDQGRAGYAAYAVAVAQRYAAQVSAVEIWNEYNGSFCDGPCKGDRPGFYANMLKTSYAALKAARPQLTVAGGAAVPIPLDWYEALFKKGALDSMDAVVIHPYRKDPEGVEEKIAQLRDLMQRYGKVKPIWATEFGDTADMRKNRDGEAGYLVKMSTLLLSEHVERIYWYLFKDYQEFTGMGLVRGENDPMGRYAAAPAYAAYAMLIHQLDGARFVRRESSDPSVRVYLFQQGGQDIRVAWSDQPGAHYQLKTTGPVAQTDMMGNGHGLSVQDGRADVPLDGTPVYLGTASP